MIAWRPVSTVARETEETEELQRSCRSWKAWSNDRHVDDQMVTLLYFLSLSSSSVSTERCNTYSYCLLFTGQLESSLLSIGFHPIHLLQADPVLASRTAWIPNAFHLVCGKPEDVRIEFILDASACKPIV